MTESHKDAFRDMRRSSGKVLSQIPDVLRGYSALGKGAVQDGAVSVKNKELIALGIAITTRCEGCIQAHVTNAIRAGASKEEMYETIGVAILMSGGPGTVYGAKAYDVIEEFMD